MIFGSKLAKFFLLMTIALFSAWRNHIMHNDYLNSGELKNSGDTQWLYAFIKCRHQNKTLIMLQHFFFTFDKYVITHQTIIEIWLKCIPYTIIVQIFYSNKIWRRDQRLISLMQMKNEHCLLITEVESWNFRFDFRK